MKKCSKCGKEKHDRGMMYCGICSDCCIKLELCEDCGNPIDSPDVLMCSGWHGKIYKEFVMKENVLSSKPQNKDDLYWCYVHDRASVCKYISVYIEGDKEISVSKSGMVCGSCDMKLPNEEYHTFLGHVEKPKEKKEKKNVK